MLQPGGSGEGRKGAYAGAIAMDRNKLENSYRYFMRNCSPTLLPSRHTRQQEISLILGRHSFVFAEALVSRFV